MATLKDWWDGFWGAVQHSPTILPARIEIARDHIDRPSGQAFKRDQHYFTVRVNRLFLKYSREFWTTYAPMGLVVSEFEYDGEDKVVPFVVGPSMLEKDKIVLPDTFVFSDTRVAGIHPYKGGGLKLTIILYRVKRTDFAVKILKVVDKIASALDFASAISEYLKIAGAMVDAIQEVIGSDNDNQPIIGLRREFDPSEGFEPGYFALVDGAKAPIEPGKLWVRKNELYFGDSEPTIKEFTQATYILYSIGQATSRDDIDRLPFYGQWKTALAESFTDNAEKWKSAQANWTALYQSMALSPDLISPQADALADQLYAQMQAHHNRIKERSGTMGGSERQALAEDAEIRGISERLDRVRGKSVAPLP